MPHALEYPADSGMRFLAALGMTGSGGGGWNHLRPMPCADQRGALAEGGGSRTLRRAQ
jgi:hypothetical protein